jgi:fimbrial chaperone protein
LAQLGQRADAGNFSVNPIRLEMGPAQNATALTLENFSPDPLLLQVRVFRWTHAHNEETLSELSGEEAPIVTPPLFRLAAAGSSQVVRIGFQKPRSAAEEHQWRVIIEEVGEQPKADLQAPSSVSVALRIRVSVPLLQRPKSAHQDMHWTLDPAAPGHITLTAQNLGSVTERLDEIHLGLANDKDWRFSGPVYVFPGESRSFEVQSDALPRQGNVHLSLKGTPQTLNSELVLSAQ